MSLANIPGVIDAHRRILDVCGDLTDAECRAPSRLPGWSRGHLLTHLARNAEAVARLTQGLIDGTPGVMYPGGPPARARAIEEGSGRPAAELLAQVAVASARLERLWPRVPEAAWAAGSVRGTTRDWPATNVPWMRRREVETHLVDLDVGVEIADLPADYLEQEWANGLPRLPAPVPEADLATRVAWVLGRHTPPGWPALDWS